MADQLQFRGGTTSEVSAASVASREIIIDTQTDEIAVGTSKKRTVMKESNGDVLIGGTLPSAPNIELNADGSITAGTYNTLTVGRGGGAILANTVVGVDALDANTTGGLNTAIGRLALADNTEGGASTATGYLALRFNTTGGNNTANGSQALESNTEGNNNTAMGRRALSGNTTGNNNTGIGLRSLYSNITGVRNTALGLQSGYYIEGSNNTILGAYQGTSADSTLNATVIISAGATERLRIDSTGTSTFTIPSLTNNTSIDVLKFRDSDTNTTGAGLRLVRYQNAQNYGLGIYTSQGSNAEAVRVANTGDVLIGGTLPSAPNIELNAGGSATFAGDITCTDNSKGLVLKSPDGTSFRLSVANDGTLSASSI